MDQLLNARTGNPYLIPNIGRGVKGKGVKPKAIGNRIKRLAELADLDITAHTLRAAVCTEICRKHNTAMAKEVMGHESIITTERYTRLSIDDVDEVLECV